MGFIFVLFILLLSYAVRYSIFSNAGRATGQVSNLIAFGVVSLIRFAYVYGENLNRKESRIVFFVSAVVALGVWMSIFFVRDLPVVYDFKAEYFTFEFGPRISMFTLPGFLWAIVVLFRKTVAFSRRTERPASARGVVRTLLRPAGRLARSARSFALLSLAMAVISLLYLLFQTGAISRAVYSLIFNTGSLLICLLLFVVYVNNAPQPTTFRVKLVGITLATIMVMFGIASSALMPVFHANLSNKYLSEVEQARSLLGVDGYRAIPEAIAYLLPVPQTPDIESYQDPAIPQAYLDHAATVSGVPGLLRGGNIPDPRFFYVDLEDPASFFFYYEISDGERSYRVGFRYSEYRIAVHRFSSPLALMVLVAALLVVPGFALVFNSGLIKPLGELLEAVRQVEAGNYRMILPVKTRDEIGRLARGYNRMVEALQNAEGNFKALAENANDVILILSKKGRLQYANAHAEAISGYNAIELRQRGFRDMVHPRELAKVENRFEARMRGQAAPRCYETLIVDKAGGIVPVEITGARTIWQGEPADVVVLRDISDRKQAEEQLRTQQQQLLRADKLASLGALVAGVAHEINNPNQVVSMNASFLREGLPGLFAMAESSEEADDSIRVANVPYGEFKLAADTCQPHSERAEDICARRIRETF
jgi:PAS domain S-box-containing protein